MGNKNFLKCLYEGSKNIPTGSFLGCIEAKSVLVIAPHPDDELIGCGGTMMKYLQEGTTITLLIVTDGQYGDFSKGNVNRKKECIDVWGKYENLELIFLNHMDSNITNELIDIYKELIAEKKQEIIYIPWIIDRHIDNINVNKYLAYALKAMNFDQTIMAFYEVMYPLYANKITNISKVYACKEKMLRKYISQIDYLNLYDVVRSMAQLRAAHIRLRKVKYAEAFFVCSIEWYIFIVTRIVDDE